MRLADLNALPDSAARAELLRCCGSSRWALMMASARPFATADMMAVHADAVWSSLDATDWLEAFRAHPRIGESVVATGAAGPGESDGAGRWSEQEQALVQSADDAVRHRLAEANRRYEARFGYIFIVCATGTRADEILVMLERRLTNDPDLERRIAAEEQRRITRLRIAKLIAA